jgi:hypothetical protein
MLEHPVKKKVLAPGTIGRKYIKVWMQNRRRTLSPAGNIQHAPHPEIRRYLARHLFLNMCFCPEVDTSFLKGDFFGFFFLMYVSSAAPPIHLCRRMLGSNDHSIPLSF